MQSNPFVVPGEFPGGVGGERPVRHLNWPAALALTALAVVGAAGFVGLWTYQNSHIGRAVLAQAHRLDEKGQTERAVEHLDQYLVDNPDDLAALELRASLLARSAGSLDQIEQATHALDLLVRRDPDAPGRDATRRKLAELHVRHGDGLRRTSFFRTAPELAAHGLRYGTAALIARQLIAKGAKDADAYRILAMSLEGLAGPADKENIAEAIKNYVQVLKVDPGDVVSAERLARLYKDRQGDLGLADKVMETMGRVTSGDVETRVERHLARYRYFFDLRRLKQAEAELLEALGLAPDDPANRLSAAELYALLGDLKAARGQLDAIPPAKRDVRVHVMRGRIDFVEEHPDTAIGDWREGLSTTGGTDASLTFQLAYELLQMDRVAEAKPLIDQYRRLIGDDESPAIVLLDAIMDEKSKRPERAIRALERIRDRIGESLEEKFHLARGQCYEGLWDDAEADRAYALAQRIAPSSTAPRLGRARLLLLRGKTDDAIEVLDRGLGEVNNGRPLLLALLRALELKQAAIPLEGRDWAYLDRRLLDAANDILLKNSPTLATIQADRLVLGGKPEGAIRRLEEAAASYPRSVEVHLALANGLIQQKRPGDALKALEQASRPDHAGDVAMLRIARAKLLLSLGRGRQARDLLARDIGRLPRGERPLVWQTLGEFYAAQGNVGQARRAYDAWAGLLPDDPRPRRATLQLALDNSDQALVERTLDQLRASRAGDDEVAWRIGRAMVLLQSKDVRNAPPGSTPGLREAEALVAATLSVSKGLPVAHLLMGQIRKQQERYDDAIASYQKALGYGEQAALPRLFDLLFQQKKFDEIAKLRRGSTLGSQLDRLSAELALRAGETDQADRFVEEAIKARPESAEPRVWRARMFIKSREVRGRRGGPPRPGREPAQEHRILAVAAPLSRRPASGGRGRRRDHGRDPGAIRRRPARAAPGPLRLDRRRPDEGRQGHRRGDPAASRLRPGPPARGQVLRGYAPARRGRGVPAGAPGARPEEPGGRAPPGLDPVGARRRPRVLGAGLGRPRPRVRGPRTSRSRMFRAVVLSRCPDTARRRGAIDDLEELVADLPANSRAAAAPRDLLVRLLTQAGQTGPGVAGRRRGGRGRGRPRPDRPLRRGPPAGPEVGCRRGAARPPVRARPRRRTRGPAPRLPDPEPVQPRRGRRGAGERGLRPRDRAGGRGAGPGGVRPPRRARPPGREGRREAGLPAGRAGPAVLLDRRPVRSPSRAPRRGDHALPDRRRERDAVRPPRGRPGRPRRGRARDDLPGGAQNHRRRRVRHRGRPGTRPRRHRARVRPGRPPARPGRLPRGSPPLSDGPRTRPEQPQRRRTTSPWHSPRGSVGPPKGWS